MADYLPFMNSRVSVRKSIGSCMDMLEQSGFEETGQHSKNGEYTVYAAYKKTPFEFSVNIEAVRRTLINNLGERTQAEIRQGTPQGRNKMLEISNQAQRVGWRLMSLHIKAVCDSIKLGVLTPADAFAGHALLPDAHGGKITLAQKLTKLVEEGKFNSANVFMIEGPK